MIREWTAIFPAIAHSGKLADLPDDTARLFYLMLLPQCDAHGRIMSSPRALSAEVWPLLHKTSEETQEAIEDCARAGLIELHKLNNLEWVQIPDWEEKAGSIGRRRERHKSRFPDPDPATAVSVGVKRCGPVGSGGKRCKPGKTVRPSSPLQESGLSTAQPPSSESPGKQALVSLKASDAREESPQARFVAWFGVQFQENRGQAYVPSQLDFIKAAAGLKRVGSDKDEVARRTGIMLRTESPYHFQKASPAHLFDHWNEFAVEIHRLTKEERRIADIQHDLANVNPLSKFPELLNGHTE